MNKKDAKDVKKRVKDLSSDDEMVYLNDIYSRADYEIEGLLEDKASSIAKNMLKDKLNPNLISKYTGLSKREIASIKF